MKPVQGKTKVKRSRLHGYGVFAVRDIRKHEIIEQMPALIVREKHLKKMPPEEHLETHTYRPTAYRERWIGTGHSSFFNAGRNPNAEPEYTTENGLDWLVIFATRPIKAGEEITLDYLAD